MTKSLQSLSSAYFSHLNENLQASGMSCKAPILKPQKSNLDSLPFLELGQPAKGRELEGNAKEIKSMRFSTQPQEALLPKNFFLDVMVKKDP
jgi:hypothetical protein